MKIDFEVLWFEDQPDALIPDIDNIRSFLAESGFNLKCDMRPSISVSDITILAQRLEKYNPYDLIMFDYDLGGGEEVDGSIVARSLRSHVFTEMVFYSGVATADLRRILFDKQIDGVFPLDRFNLSDSLIPLLDDYIKKICDINNVRGVVMDQVSQFDRSMRTICSEILISLGEDEQSKVKADIKRRIKKSGEIKIKKSEQIDCPISALEDHKLSDFNLVRQRLHSMSKELENFPQIFADGKELSELQNLRNRLAHIEGELSDDGTMRLADDCNDTFDFSRFKSIRRSLLEISGILKGIKI